MTNYCGTRPSIFVDGGPDTGYVDADVYFVMDDKSEWKLRFSYEYEGGSYFVSDAMFSAGPEDSFDDSTKEAPREVQAIFNEMELEICGKINERIAYMALPVISFRFKKVMSYMVEAKGRTREEARARAETEARISAGIGIPIRPSQSTAWIHNLSVEVEA